MGSEEFHDGLVRELSKLLQERYDYEIIDTHVDYHRNGYDGEFDILAIKDDVFYYWEVKSTYHKGSKNRAWKQFRRAKKAFPRRPWKFILYTPKRIRRYLKK